jgi:purine-binding chemotaxis protein CheW
MEANYLTFFIGKSQFCIPAEKVVEINRNCDYTIVPGAPEVIKGILNLRGQLIVAFDMSSLLGVASEPSLSNAVSILVKVDSSTISLMVDRVGDILVLGESTFESPPNNFSFHMRNAVLGAHKLPDSLLIIIDPNLFINQLTTTTSATELLPTSI